MYVEEEFGSRAEDLNPTVSEAYHQCSSFPGLGSKGSLYQLSIAA